MKLCDNIAEVLLFCQRDPVRYRHIVHELDPPCPEWDDAMRRCHYVDGEGVVIDDSAGQEDSASARLHASYYLDNAGAPTLLVRVSDDNFRVEGTVNNNNTDDLLALIQKHSPRNLLTYHQAVADFLGKKFNSDQWECDGAEYVATDRFTPQLSAPVLALTPDNRPLWQRFVDRNAGDPMVKARNGSQAVVRDFLFMAMGLPVRYFVTLEDGEITGMASVNPMTRSIDEISALFVDPVHRRKGLARTLISAAVESIHARGRTVAYHAAGNPQDRPDLYKLLTSLGFELVTCPYATRLDW